MYENASQGHPNYLLLDFFSWFAAVVREFLSLKYPLAAVSIRKSIYWN